MKRIAVAAILIAVLFIILQGTAMIMATIEDQPATQGTALQNVSTTITTWSAVSTSLVTVAIALIAIGTIVAAVYTLVPRKR